MKQELNVLVILLIGFSAAVEKPGLCALRSSATFGACVITCGEDSDCSEYQKCCSNGCGQTCQDPACPKGVSKVACPSSLCIFSQCPNAPDAHCRIDSCGQCKVEYYNKTTWEKVICTNAGKHLCERMREFGRANPLPGRYVPTCTKEGKFASPQRMGSVLFCVDEETGIPDFTTNTPIGKGLPDCTKKGKTKCQLAKERAEKLPAIGRFVPKCKEDGSYEEMQCHPSTGYCWCVDEKGREWFGTRQRKQLDCAKSMCAAGVTKVEGCDPMICAAATCPGYQKSEVSCRINPCGQCKAEFLDKYNRIATCQTCATKRANILSKSGHLIGQYVPQCDVDGNYKQVQYWGSVGLSWCVDRVSGVQIDGTKTRGTPNCKRSPVLLLGAFPGSRTTRAPPKPREPVCPNGFPMLLCLRAFGCQWSSGCAANSKATCQINPCKMCAVEYFDENDNLVDCKGEMTDCQLKRADAFSSKHIGLQPVGRFIPQCDKDGNYSRIQCWGSTGYCWCVDPVTGVEQELTRVRGRPNCATKTRENLFVNKTEVKPGRCPTVKPTDTCDKACDSDKECPGKAKCCKVGCGMTCREPDEAPLACPNGFPFLLCLHHCQLASCPAHPEAQCTVDPCHMCKVDFKDAQGNVVNCLENLTPCQLQRAKTPALLGSYRPQCESDGRYTSTQCHGSTGFCWCVDKDGREIDNTRQRGSVNCTAVAKKKALSKCQQMRARVLSSGLLGAKAPQCEDDGRFKKIQTWEGYQWCVDEHGIELRGTKTAPGEGAPDCSKACSQVMCMMYCQYGFVKDSRGCEICKCAPAPYKPGVCPPPGTKAPPAPSVACTEDLDCRGTMKCCDKKCSVAINYVKPGFCPHVNATNSGDCLSKCSQDSDCDGDKKCCARECNRECVPPAKEVCPNGAPLVMCLRNMCDGSDCPAYPEATCRMNYCGHCSAEFLLPNGTIVDCGSQDNKKTDKKYQCTGKNRTMFFCSSTLCDGQKCAKYPKATCKVPPLSCDCTPKFYDKKGNEIDCLTECQRKRKELESGPPLIGAFKPNCEADGTYSRKQCSGSTGFCWCVSEDGTKWPGTDVRGEPDCSDKKKPDIRSIVVQLSFDADFYLVDHKPSLDKFKSVFKEHMKQRFGVHPEQISDIEVSRGSIVVKFVLLKVEDGKDISNVSNHLRNMVLEGEFVFEFSGQSMVAKPESYVASLKMKDEQKRDGKSESTAVLAIVLGVVFGVLAIIVIVGVIIYVRKRSYKDTRGMSVNTYDSQHPLKE